jgi:hypothetical protein
MLDRPHRIKAEMLGAVGEGHLRSPDFVIRSPVKVLEEVAVPDAHQPAPFQLSEV